MNHEVFAKGIVFLHEAFPKKEINAKLFFEALKDLTDNDFELAIMKIVKTHTELYPHSNLIAIIREYCQGKSADRALLAWSTAIAACLSVGQYKSVSFQDEIINGVISAMGGWEQFNNMPIEDKPFRQKDFISLYEVILKSGRKNPSKLVGYSERINGLNDTPELIECDWIKTRRKELTRAETCAKGA